MNTKPNPLTTEYTDDERRGMLAVMKTASNTFYQIARRSGCHAMIEFTGLMNEYIKVCEEARAAGIPFEFANNHGGPVLPFKPHHLRYIAEKLECIYGPGLLATRENREAFLHGLFHSEASDLAEGPG